MADYTSNSHRSKQEDNGNSKDKKIEKIATGTIKKKSFIQKLSDIFISEDVNSVKSYVVMDVLIPAIKDAVEDIVTNGIHMVLRGESGSRKKNSTSKVSYRKYYDRSDERRSHDNSILRTSYGYDNIKIDSRGEAEEVLMKMEELIDVYGLVSVADFYDLVGVKGSYTDNKYGWTNIRTADVVRIRDGYMLKLPKALPLD